jgi:AAA15 family ATPase/GTPase
LHGAVIYGANAGGKTNLIRAIAFFQSFVTTSAKNNPEEKIDVEPFRLDPSCTVSPSDFEIIFAENDTLYQYGFSADESRVFAEWLYATPKDGRIRHIFNREYSAADDQEEWYINPRLKGEKKSWQESTKKNSLFLSTAVQLNSIDLSIPFGWIAKKLRVLLGHHFFPDQYTSHACHAHDQRSSVLEMLRSVDLGIVDLKISEEDWDEKSIPSSIPDDLRNHIVKEMRGKKIYTTELLRQSRDGTLVKFDIDDESTGTSLLYSLAGPWLDALCYGQTLVIDELDSGLHPLALRSLVSMFFDPKQNVGNAQLVITCHEATLLRDDLLRADQVWFIDRNDRDGSRIYPLSEFKPRKNESYLRGYLGGRFGGIPLAPSTH